MLVLFTLLNFFLLIPLPLLQPVYGATLTAAEQAGKAVDFINSQYLSGQTVDGFAASTLEQAGEDLSGEAWTKDNLSLRKRIDSLADLLGNCNTLLTYIIATQNEDGTFGPYANEYGTKAPLQALGAAAGDTSGTEVDDEVNKVINQAVSYFREGWQSGTLTYDSSGWSFDYRCVAALAAAGEDLSSTGWVYDGLSLQERAVNSAREAAANPQLHGPVELAKELLVLIAVDPASPDIDALADGIIAQKDDASPGKFGSSVYDDVLVLNALGQAGRLVDLDQHELLAYLNTYKHVHNNSWGTPAGAAWGGFAPEEPDLTAQVLNTLAYFTDVAKPDSNVYAAIQDGLAYLADIQDQNTAAIPAQWDSTYATAEVLLALKALGCTYEDYAGDDSAWLKKSPTKTVAQCLLAANQSDGSERVERLVSLLAERQIIDTDGDASQGSFENSVYSDMWAYLALGKAGKISAIDTEAARDYILSKQGADGSWGETFSGVYYPDVLSTTQAIRSLTYLSEASSNGVEGAITNGLAYLKNLQQPDGGVYAAPFDDPAIDNSELVVTLCRLNQDPAAAEWKNAAGLTPVDYLLNNTMNGDGSFGTSRNIMGAAEALSAFLLVAGEGSPAGENPQPSEDDDARIKVKIAVVGADGHILFGPEGVRVSQDGLWGNTVLGALDATGLSYSADSRTGFVSDIEGQANSGMNGWMYKVNEVVASKAGNEQLIKEGDRIVWWYSQDINSTGPAWKDLLNGYVPASIETDEEIIAENQSLEKLTTQEALAALKELNQLLGGAQDKSELGSVGEAGLAVHVVGGGNLPARSEYLTLRSKLTANTVDLAQSAAADTGAIIQDALPEVTLVIPGGALTKDLIVTVKKVSASNNTSNNTSNIGSNSSVSTSDNSYNNNNSTSGNSYNTNTKSVSSNSGFPEGYQQITPVFSFGPDGTFFKKPVACALKIALPPLVKPDNLVLAYYYKAENAWNALPAVVDADNGLILAHLKHFSDYTVLARQERKAFTDVTPDECGWAQDAIEMLAGFGVVDGTDHAQFEPNRPITRAELTKILVKVLNLTADETETTFVDVPKTAWYAGYTTAAARAGLVKGYEDGSFCPDRLVTREELAVVLVRGLELTAQPGAAGSFSDVGMVSPWAKDFIPIAAGSGLVHGYPDGTFQPQGQVTRAECAAMFCRAL